MTFLEINYPRDQFFRVYWRWVFGWLPPLLFSYQWHFTDRIEVFRFNFCKFDYKIRKKTLFCTFEKNQNQMIVLLCFQWYQTCRGNRKRVAEEIDGFQKTRWEWRRREFRTFGNVIWFGLSIDWNFHTTNINCLNNYLISS